MIFDDHYVWHGFAYLQNSATCEEIVLEAKSLWTTIKRKVELYSKESNTSGKSRVMT